MLIKINMVKIISQEDFNIIDNKVNYSTDISGVLFIYFTGDKYSEIMFEKVLKIPLSSIYFFDISKYSKYHEIFESIYTYVPRLYNIKKGVITENTDIPSIYSNVLMF